jgi:hypothetical protein
MFFRISVFIAICTGLVSLTGCGVTGGTSSRKLTLNTTLTAVPLAHGVKVGEVSARPNAGVNRAIGAYNFGRFDDSDLNTLRQTLERTLPDSTAPTHTVHVLVQHFGLTFTNNRGACLAIIDWCVVQNGVVAARERFYAAYDTGDKILGTETMGMSKNRVLHAAARRIAERALATANGLDLPPAPPLTFDDPQSANAQMPVSMDAAGSGLIGTAVQQTMLGSLSNATRLLPDDPLPPADWPSILHLHPQD